MKVVKVEDMKAEAATGDLFIGDVKRHSLADPESVKEFRASLITFSPGARNVFHTHTREQILYVTDGKGIVATEEQEHIVSPGTIIFIPAGERHWHGATQYSNFSHISITPVGLQTSF
jgi:quercetin dioxygenase-like cupin family protein